jgi:hypothetical protein
VQVDPPDVLAGQAVLQMVGDRGWKADGAFYGFLMRGMWRAGMQEELMETYFTLPAGLGLEGGDRAALAALVQVGRGKIDKVPGLLQAMRRTDEAGAADLMGELLGRLVQGEHWKPALEALELMIDLDVTLGAAQRRALATALQANPVGPALEVREGGWGVCACR